ncbi:hypothetical protein Chor_002007 [Crotalus horridus]
MSFILRSSRELWTILLGRSALREPAQIAEELNKHWQRLLEGLRYYRPPRYGNRVLDIQHSTQVRKSLEKHSNSAEIVKADKNVPASLKELGLRVSKFLTVLQDERQSQTLLLKIADYYYEERFCILRCVLHILTYFQDERHPYMVPYSQCMEKLDKELVPNYRKQFEELYKAETERHVSRWFVQCLREQSMLLEIIFLYYAYFEMTPEELLTFAKLFKEQGFGSRQTNRHLVDESMDPLVDRIGYFSSLILVEGMEIDSLHERLLDDRKEEHKFAGNGQIRQEMDRLLLNLGDIPHHAPVLLAWALLRHTLSADGSSGVIRRMGSTAIQMNVFQYLTKLLRAISCEGNEPTAGLGIILDSVCGMFPHLLSPLLHLLTALVSDKSTTKKVYTFLDKMSFYIELYKHKPADVISHEDGTLWRRQTPKLLYPLGAGQTNLRIPQGTIGQVMLDDRAYLVRWEYSYSSWTLFTCEIEMLLHVVSTADVIQHCQRVKPIIDLVHKVISTDVSIADCLLPITSRIYMLLQSAEGMNAGGYGNLLMGIEQPQGEYSVTISFLNLVMTLVRGQLGSTQSQGLVPCIVFVLKEMLPNYHKWRYNSHGVREKIGYLILQLIHAILNLCPEMDPRSSAPSLQSLCIFSLANTEAGQAVISIMGIGVDTIDMVMASQSCSDGESQGQLLIQTVKLAFSVTNNVIRLKPPSSVVSPLEHALTQHGAHRNNLIAVLAKYIYHKHDPALPRLAIQLLKRLATVAPMSVYACLGSDASAIRDAFLTRLQSRIEDMRIKVMILDFLTVAVETQPGLIELFLNLEVKDGSDGCKEFSLGEWSCLHVVLELMDSKRQERYWCPPLLQRATIAFLHALWQDRRDSAMLVLRNKGSLDQSLKDTLKRFSAEKRFAYWSGYVKSLAFHVAETGGSGCTSLTDKLGSVDEITNSLTQILDGVLQADQQMMEKTKAKVFSALVTVLQMKETKASEIPHYSQLVLSVCETLQEEFIALFGHTRRCLSTGDALEDKDSMDTDDVCVLGLHLAKELCEVDEEGDCWLQVTRTLSLLPTLCSTLEVSLRLKQNLHFTEASLHLLLTLAKTQQGAAAVATAGILHSICLPLLSVYQLSSNGGGQAPVSSRRSLDGPSWPGVYRLAISLMERLLKTLRYNFLTDALDFCLNAVRTVQSLACLEEADHTVGFLLQLSNFVKEWHFQLPQLLRDVQAKNGESLPSAVLPRLQRAPQTLAKPAGPESEAAEQRALSTVQYSLLKILSKCLAALRHFTPDLCQILLDQSTLLSSLSRYFRRGGPSSPAGGLLPTPQGKPSSKLGPEGQEPLFQLVQTFVRHVQR